MKTLAVFFGGKSNEHDISVITGMFCCNLLQRSELRVVPVYLPKEGGMRLCRACSVEEFRDPRDGKKFLPVYLDGRDLVLCKRHKRAEKLDCALNCCHGGAGEDGTLSALLRWHGVPFASPDAAVSSVFINKEFSQIAARGLGIPVARSFAVSEREWREESGMVHKRAEELGFPVIVKPSRLGSSIGIKVAKDGAELAEALTLAFRLDDGALIEEYFAQKRDINCAAYAVAGKVTVSECEEVFSSEEILTFSEKYEGTGMRSGQQPADLPPELSDEIREYTRRIYEGFHVRGIVRADFLIVDGKAYFNELNTVPGSLACYLFGESLVGARELLVTLARDAMNGFGAEKEIVSTGILNDRVFTGTKRGKRM